jgi:hypothetical protein
MALSLRWSLAFVVVLEVLLIDATVEMTRTPLSPLLCIIDRGGSHLSNLHRIQSALTPLAYFQQPQWTHSMTLVRINISHTSLD